MYNLACSNVEGPSPVGNKGVSSQPLPHCECNNNNNNTIILMGNSINLMEMYNVISVM